MIPLFQKSEIRRLEQLAIESGIPEYELMERAGEATFRTLMERWPAAKHVIVCCGSGNNGGDGLVVAYLAKKRGFSVDVYLTERPKPQSSAAQALKKCESLGILLQSFPKVLDQFFIEGDVLVDALFGIGLSQPIKSPYAEIIAALNYSPIPKLSIDVPSGLNADTGVIEGCAVRAACTVTFIASKSGLYTGAAANCTGDIVVDALGIPLTLIPQVEPIAYLLEEGDERAFSPRLRHADKGYYGHVLVVGGDYGMGGAVRMAAEAALRVGAGLVSVATRPEHVSVVNNCRPEIMCHQVIHPEDLLPLLKRATVLVVGPGLGKTPWARSLLDVLFRSELPMVLDADGLNLLSESPLKKQNWILTPHPGEAARLLDTSYHDIQNNRFNAVERLHERYQGIIVLKGAGTLIKSPYILPRVCSAGNPGMATGGMGDVLSGVIGGLLAQQLTLTRAAEVGVLIHALAADRAVERSGERGLLATDLFPYLRTLVN